MMNAAKSIHVIDSHTMGEPTRIIIGGVPVIPGKTMPEKKEYLEKNLDYIRSTIMLEPRGHADMFGSIITQPTLEEADLGIIFMDAGGYLNMCGHGSIGASTVAVETGMVPVTEPYTNITFETPAGLIKARVKVENGKAIESTITNAPSFLYKSSLEFNIPDFKKIKVDIAFGGSFFILVNSEEIGIEICPENARKISQIAMKIRDFVNKNCVIEHPTLKHIKKADLVEVYGPAKNPKAHCQNVVIFGDGQVDRSPCGTGTSAKIATLVAKGELNLNEEFVYESILGTIFKGKAIKEVTIGDYTGIITEITASAYITGFNHLVIDADDPLKYGFKLK